MRLITAAAVGIAAASGAAFGAGGCGGADKPPARGVIENDVEDWSFRRYQSVLDIEVWVPDNRAVAHTASYARKEAEKRGRLGEDDVVSAFVTRYERDAGIDRALIQFVRRLARESGYQVSEREIGDVRVVELKGAGEVWAVWPASAHVVKIGGPGRTSVPASVIEAYGERYPSHLKAGALDGPLPPGSDAPEPADEPATDGDDDRPRPQWKKGKKRPSSGATGRKGS